MLLWFVREFSVSFVRELALPLVAGLLLGYSWGAKRMARRLQNLAEQFDDEQEQLARARSALVEQRASEAHDAVGNAAAGEDLAAWLRRAHAAVTKLERAAHGLEH